MRLPDTIGLLFLAILVSIGTILLDRAVPGLALQATARDLVERANLPQTFLNGALGFLLFAGAFHVDLEALWYRRWRVLALATIGVVLATVLFGAGIYLVFRWWLIEIPLIWCFVLGSIVAPTDPVAVLGVLKRVGLEPGLQATIGGESLFNDGVGVVVFTILLAMATGASTAVTAAGVLTTFMLEAVGGALLGLATGYVAFLAMRSIDKYDLELMISLALVMVTYSGANLAGLSGPIAVAVAGLLIGNHGTRHAMSEMTRRYVETFWLMIDEILNALLFLLIGFELVAVELRGPVLAAAGVGVLLAVAVRTISVAAPMLAFDFHMPGKTVNLVALTWGGLRGGVSVALALTLPDGPYRGPLLSACYAIVIFTVVVQGMTLEPVLRLVRGSGSDGESAGQT